MMKPAHLDLFRAVLRHGGMTRAAAVLGVGQPHVSRAIAQLEAELGFRLFVRGHGSAVPTPQGRAFAHEVERSRTGLEQLRQAAHQIRDIGHGPLRITCQPSLASRLLPRVVEQLTRGSPGVKVTIHVPDPDTAWSWASSGQCDLGLTRPRAGFAAVVSEPFLSVDAVCALHQTHALARRPIIRVTDLTDEALIAGAPGTLQYAVERVLADAGITPRFALTAQYTAARCGLVAAGLGLTIVDPIAAVGLSDLPIVLRPFLPSLPIETVLIRPLGQVPDDLVVRAVTLLKAERDTSMAEIARL